MPSQWCTGGIGDNGEARWEYFRNVVAVPSIKKTGGALRSALHLIPLPLEPTREVHARR